MGAAPHPMLDYTEARRRARSLWGNVADVEFAKGAAYPYRVGVKLKGRLNYLGVGSSWVEAFADAQRRADVGAPKPIEVK